MLEIPNAVRSTVVNRFYGREQPSDIDCSLSLSFHVFCCQIGNVSENFDHKQMEIL